jgi:hypothetical protein
MSKTYIEWTSCKSITWQFWEFFVMSFNPEKMDKYSDKDGYVKVVMSKRKEVGMYWDTHYFTLNEYEKKD